MKDLNNYISEKLHLNKDTKNEVNDDMIIQEICDYLKERNLLDISHIYF